VQKILPWQLRSADPFSRVVELEYQSDEFTHDVVAELAERSDVVEIRVQADFRPPGGKWFADVDHYRMSVELAAPLADRALFAVIETSEGEQVVPRSPSPAIKPGDERWFAMHSDEANLAVSDLANELSAATRLGEVRDEDTFEQRLDDGNRRLEAAGFYEIYDEGPRRRLLETTRPARRAVGIRLDDEE
jgi:hypothetical protein